MSNIVHGFHFELFLALSITLNVVSGDTRKNSKRYRDNNLSGNYHMTDIVNDRPVYKVSLFLPRNILQ